MKRADRPLSPFLAWPDFFAAQPFSLRAMVNGLDASQRLTSAAVVDGQWKQLRLLLEWAVNNVPHYCNGKGYGDLLRAIRHHPEDIAILWSQLPILTKSELRFLGPLLNARSVPVAHQPLDQTRTSGSTGIPVEIKTTALSRMIWDALTVREHLWQGRNFAKRLGIIRFRKPAERISGGEDLPSWGTPVANLFPTGPASAIHIGYPIVELAAWLQRFDPQYLLTYPSVMAALYETMCGNRPPALEEIRLMSEPVDLDFEQRLKMTWGVRCSDVYSANEVGYIAFRCHEGAMHIQSESVFVEILDASGAHCAFGETGRVVITPMHNLATPLIRYEIGDYATVGAPCDCGRHLPVIAAVQGRVRNMVRTPDGRRFWPVALGKIRSIVPIRQAQYVQTALETIELRVVLDRPLTDAELDQTRTIVQQVLGYPFKVDIAGVAQIDRGPTGKYEEFHSLLPDEQSPYLPPP